MTTRTFNLLILLLIIIGLGGCGEKDPPPAEDPSKDIIGKWELVAEEQEGNRIVPIETDGYIEYLANGVLQFFPNGYGETRITYQIDNVYLYRYLDDIVAPHTIYEYTFINRNKLKLKEFYSVNKRMLYPYPFIYQRIKE